MSTERICRVCHQPLVANAPQGLCPACLMKAGFDTGAAPAAGEPSRLPRFAAPEVPEVAKLFPQLEIQHLLGQGGMGAVYRARQPALDRLVALKILPPQSSADAEFADRFTREARALARLNHPNVVGVYEFGVVDGLHYFIMEFVDGLNLRQVQQAGRISPRETLKIIPQICDALQYAHDEGVVHRDIKPENVMLDKKGRVKITDFGLARILGLEAKDLRLTGAEEVMGTPHYMAPEQIEHPQAVDHRADIYSLGVVFYEILTGELPLGRFERPSKKVAIDVRLDEVVLHALEKEPDRRYQHASQVKSDVETIVSRPRSEGVWRARVAVWLLLLLALGSMATLMMMSRKGRPAAAGHLLDPRRGGVASPALQPASFRTVELPRATVRYAGFDEAYAVALGRILQEALKVYEAHGFKMPPKASLDAQINPQGTQLWTDGASHLFLHLKSKELLAPASRTGVFNIYGLCHELGHIALYRSLASLMGLPQGVADGWADYAGKVVVTEVASRLGKSIWPEYYDVAEVEGIGRLKRDAAQAKPWDKLDPTLRACLVFYRIETEYGRDKLAAAMTAALAERPTGKALMPLVLGKLRAATGNPAAADWAPRSVLEPQVEWQTKERSPGDDFFADQQAEKDATGLWLRYDTGDMSGKLSISGSAQTVLFRPPEGSWELDGLKLFSARYGTAAPPKEDLSIYICDERFNLLHEVKAPYSSFERGEEKWQTVSFPPVAVPKTFYLGIDFHATSDNGVYLGMDKAVKRSHSRLAMPYERVSDMTTRADWMLRPHLVPTK